MLIKIIELGMPLDEVFYCEIMFDDKTSGEMPLMADFIPKAEKILKDKFNIEVKHIKAKVSFKDQFYKVKQKGNRIGDNYGFPFTVGSWCNSRLKIEPIHDYLKSFKEPIIQYVGIAYDEPIRYERLDHSTHIAPLYDLKITEDEAFEICRKYDLVSPQYNESYRGGCWFCVKQSIDQLKNLYVKYPKLWNTLKEMEKDSRNTFKIDTTLEQLEHRFENEERQLKLF